MQNLKKIAKKVRKIVMKRWFIILFVLLLAAGSIALFFGFLKLGASLLGICIGLIVGMLILWLVDTLF